MIPVSHPNLTYLDGLNPEQRQAVETTEGPVLVLAGAGTGKTKALTTRLGHLLTTGRASPAEILTVTFTNKAAAEMKRRVSAMLGGREVEGWWLGTFHALCARMLRRHAELAGLKSTFSILDDDDQIRLLKQLMEAENLDTKKCPPRLLMGAIQRWKDRAQSPADLASADGAELAEGKAQKIYAEYQARLKVLNACDFGDLLLHVITILKNPAHRDILEGYQRRFKYILVDEYQDTNVAQYLWLRLLAQGHKNICCVGDDDQSIYGWRGAEIGNILKFEQDFPGATVIRLEQNYRSTAHILSAANGVIAHNKSRLGKNLWSAAGDGEKVSVRGVWDGPAEAQAIAEDIERLRKNGAAYRDIAVLVRASFQTRAFEERFMREVIPYQVIGGLRFYERQEIRDAIAYLRVTVQPDDDLAFERIINLPKRGLGDATLQVMHRTARARNISLYRAAEDLAATDELKPKVRETLRRLFADFDRWRQELRQISHTEVTQIILDESGYTNMWLQDKSPEAAGRLENLKEFITALDEFDNLDAFLEHVALVMDRQSDDSADMVSVMTLHSAKGLEFNTVFLPGWEEGVFPNQRAMDESGMAGLEEERRLAYVGITRARRKACIYFAANRQIYGSWAAAMPSRFIAELPKDHIDVMTATGLVAGEASSSPYARTQGYGHSHGGGYGQNRQIPQRRSNLYAEEVFDDIPSVSLHQESEAGFGPGNRVFHEKFGTGTVLSVDHDKLDISFDRAGRKKVLDSFVKKA